MDATKFPVEYFTVDKGYRTADIMSGGGNLVGCSKCGDLICENLRKGC